MKNPTLLSELHKGVGSPSSETVQSLRLLKAFVRLGPRQRFKAIELVEPLEKQNPELASAMRKLQRLGPTVDPQKAQAALSQLSATERRAYMEAVEEQGAMPEAANRQMRRMQQRMQGGGSGPGGGGPRPGGGGSRKRKKR